MAVSSRHSNDIFLIGFRELEPITNLNQLPTLRQVLRRFHEYLKHEKNVRRSVHLVLDELVEVWARAAIPTKHQKHCVDKLELIHKKWLLLNKNKSRSSQSQTDRENLFITELDKLFDIAHIDAINQIRIGEDKKFLIDQRSERKMAMSSLDKELASKIERAEKRKRRAELLKQKANENLASTSKTQSQHIFSSSDDSNDDYDKLDPNEVRYTLSATKKSVGDLSTSSEIFTTHVTSALDRNKITDREAMRLIIPLAAAFGQDPASLSISRSTIRRSRKKARTEFNAHIRESFAPNYPLVVHWDGKILLDIVENKKVDRLPVLVSGNDTEKLLGVPKLTSGSGESIADAVLSLMENWNLSSQVQAMSFDTTAANTGVRKGACALLEAGIGES